MAAKAQPFSVAGKNAIVTGAGSGINYEFAKLLLERGCNVVIADLSLRPEAQDLVSKYDGKSGRPRAVFCPTDVTKWKALRAMFTCAYTEFGDVDLVCPGAGVYEPHWSSFWHPPGSPESRDDDDHKSDASRYALLDINVVHPIRTTQLALAHWFHPDLKATPKARPASRADNPKRVVHISSVAGQLPVFRAPLYGASKYAVTGFVRALAPLEASHGIRVNAVAPGVVKTPLWMEHPEKLVNVNQEQDGWVTAREVAEAMLRCAEDPEGGGLAGEGGVVLEVGKGNSRRVEWCNDPGPDMDPKKGFIASNGDKGDQMIWDWLTKPKIWGAKL